MANPIPVLDDADYLGGLLRRGQTLGGWQISAKLPVSSGEAEIYLALQQGQTAVLKYYRDQARPKEAVLARIQGWKLPGLMAILTFGEYRGDFYEVMEYLPGGSLQGRKLTEDQALPFVAEVTQTLAACHEGGLIHRDVKPANLFCRLEGTEYVLGDFGIASLVASGTKVKTQNTNRTEGYAPPEIYHQIMGPPSDWYALGVTVWELLTGVEAFAGWAPGRVVAETMAGRVVDGLLARPEAAAIGPRFRSLIRGLLTHPMDRRWTDTQILSWLAGNEVEVFQGPVSQPTRPFEIGGQSYTTLPEVAQALLDHPEEGVGKVMRRNLDRWISSFDQAFADRVATLMDQLEGQPPVKVLRKVALTLDPGRSFRCADGTLIDGLAGLGRTLESQPESVIRHLKTPDDLLWDHLDHWGVGDLTQGLQTVLASTKSTARAVNLLLVALSGQVIRPFRGTRFSDTELSRLDQLKALPAELRDRFLLDLEDRNGLLAVWLEDVSGRAYPTEWLEGLPDWDEVVGYWLGARLAKAKPRVPASPTTKSAPAAPEQVPPKAKAPLPTARPASTVPAIPMVLVEGGTFQMGTSRFNKSERRHTVTLSSFQMATTPVTQAQWKAVMGTNPSLTPGDNLPVERVSWYDAVEFCNALSLRAGLTPAYQVDKTKKDPKKWSAAMSREADGYRLPTEAEWEYAARGGNRSRVVGILFKRRLKYSGSNKIQEVAWYRKNSGDRAHPVAQKKANELGLHDMSGNVREWCWDWWGSYPFEHLTDPVGPTGDSYRTLRGGSAEENAAHSRVGYRNLVRPDFRKSNCGFRVVCSASRGTASPPVGAVSPKTQPSSETSRPPKRGYSSGFFSVLWDIGKFAGYAAAILGGFLMIFLLYLIVAVLGAQLDKMLGLVK